MSTAIAKAGPWITVLKAKAQTAARATGTVEGYFGERERHPTRLYLPSKVRRVTSATARRPVALRGNATAPAYVSTINKLINLLELPGGWNSYNAKPIRKENVTFAVSLLGRVMYENTPAPHVIPKVRGGVQIEWHTRGIDIEIDIDSPANARLSAEDIRFKDSVDEQLDEAVLAEWIDRLSW